MENKNSVTMVAFVIVALLVGGGIGYALAGSSRAPAGTMMGAAGTMSPAEFALRTTMRKLWADHVIWTREYIVAAVAGSKDVSAAAARLLKNQDDIGNAIVPYFGADAGAKLTALLRQHILIAVDVVDAAKKGDAAKLKDADARWHANAADIATFLSQADPKDWPKQTMLDMLNNHLAVTTDEAVARIKGDWNGDVAAFDQIFPQIMMMADGLSDGIVHSFPAKF